MNINDFYNYIKQPGELNEISVKEIKEVLERYPYFQAAHLLYLKNLHVINDDTYPSQLTIASLYAPNRKVLYNFIHQKETEKQMQEAPEITFSKIEVSAAKEKQKEIIQPKEEKAEIPQTKEIITDKSEIVIGETKEKIVKETQPETEKIETNKPPEIIPEKTVPNINIVKEEPVKEIIQPKEEKTEIAETKISIEEKIIKPEEKTATPEIKSIPVVEEKPVQKKPQKESLSIADQILEKVKQMQLDKKTEISRPKPVEKIPVPEEKKISKPIEEPVVIKKPEKTDAITEKVKQIQQDKKTETPVNKPVENVPIPEEKKISKPVEEPVIIKKTEKETLATPIKIKTNPELEIPKPQANPKKSEDDMTFEEWLNYLSSEKNEFVIPSENKEDSIIDNFLKNTSDLRVKPNLNTPQKDLTENMTAPENFEIISESLAQLYYKQGYLEKSLRMYEKLILKYPEKSIYFAPLIQEIKNKLY